MTTSTAPMLSVTGLRASYGKIEALKGVDLSIQHGEIVALIGANGAGKSTLMMTVFGKPRARAGSVVYDGTDITGLPTHEIARMRIAQSPEGRRIFPRMSVAENLRMGADVNEMTPAERSESLDKVLTLFPRLKERMTQRGGTLSGGEQQMLAIARATIAKPKMILLDEPSEGIMPVLVEEMGVLFRRLRDQGVTLLLVEQNVEWALRLADRAIVIDQGEVVYESSAAALLADKSIQERYCAV